MHPPIRSPPTSLPSSPNFVISGSSSPTSRPTEGQPRVADPNAATLDAGWLRTPRRLTHDLVGHPALHAEALARVAQRLPPERIESHFADLPLVHPTGAVRRISQPADEVVRDLATRTAWV